MFKIIQEGIDMAILNKNTSIGDIDNVYERLSKIDMGGGGTEPNIGRDYIVVGTQHSMESQSEFQQYYRDFTCGNEKDYKGNKL